MHITKVGYIMSQPRVIGNRTVGITCRIDANGSLTFDGLLGLNTKKLTDFYWLSCPITAIAYLHSAVYSGNHRPMFREFLTSSLEMTSFLWWKSSKASDRNRSLVNDCFRRQSGSPISQTAFPTAVIDHGLLIVPAAGSNAAIAAVWPISKMPASAPRLPFLRS